jgi:hypothetical protein
MKADVSSLSRSRIFDLWPLKINNQDIMPQPTNGYTVPELLVVDTQGSSSPSSKNIVARVDRGHSLNGCLFASAVSLHHSMVLRQFHSKTPKLS